MIAAILTLFQPVVIFLVRTFGPRRNYTDFLVHVGLGVLIVGLGSWWDFVVVWIVIILAFTRISSRKGDSK